MIAIRIEGIIVPVPQLNEGKSLELTLDDQFYLCFHAHPGICNILTRKGEVFEFYYDELGYPSTSLGCKFMSSFGTINKEIFNVNFHQENNIKYFKFSVTHPLNASIILQEITYFSKLKFRKLEGDW